VGGGSRPEGITSSTEGIGYFLKGNGATGTCGPQMDGDKRGRETREQTVAVVLGHSEGLFTRKTLVSVALDMDWHSSNLLGPEGIFKCNFDHSIKKKSVG